MNDENKKKGLFSSLSELSFVKKLKSIKHIEIIIVLIFILLLLLICFSSNDMFNFLNVSSNNAKTTSASSSNIAYIKTSDYALTLENKLKNLLSKIKGVGNVEVMVSLSSSLELEFATEQTSKTSGNLTETESKILLVNNNGSNNPIIINEKLPEINGIVIVSSGAKNTNTKLDIILAVQTLLNIDANKIQVFAGS